jgi:predicted trehalose synthase
MLRSFHNAAAAQVARPGPDSAAPEAPDSPAPAWARYWVQQVSVGFQGAYLQAAGGAAFLPQAAEERLALLDTLLLEQLLLELEGALRRQPELVDIPLTGLRQFTAPGV